MAAGTRSLLPLDERNLLPAVEPNREEIGAEFDSEAPANIYEHVRIVCRVKFFFFLLLDRLIIVRRKNFNQGNSSISEKSSNDFRIINYYYNVANFVLSSRIDNPLFHSKIKYFLFPN